MNGVLRFSVVGLVSLTLATTAAWGQARRTDYIAYLYPAGGQRGTTVQLRVGGQRLDGVHDVLITGTGVSARVVDYFRRLGNQDVALLREQMRELRPRRAGGAKRARLDQETRDLIARIEKRVSEYVNRPACASHVDLVFLEVTIAPDAKPGAREIRLVTERGVTNPLGFHVGQVPEVARKAMKTSVVQVLGKEILARRDRPEDEVEARITVPCTVNGQIASGEVNRYRFEARQGQRLVMTTAARQLVPYIADAVPGWFQPVLTLYDGQGNEVAFNDDYRFKPDPTIFFEVPKDGEYVLQITDAIYRGREDFVYRVTIGELPFVTSIFPLGAREGEPGTIAMNGWNLAGTTLAPPDSGAEPGIYRVVATGRGFVSNPSPFALDTLPECFEEESNNDPSQAQRVTLPVIINGRMDQPDDWDVFQVEGRAGETLVAEVSARRLDSPMDSVVKVTDADGNLIALNDDHEDLGDGIHTHHADSYLMFPLPADGTYYVHLGETTRAGGQAYAYRLRLSAPRPGFALRAVPSSLAIRSKGAAVVTIYAFRQDGFSGDIELSLKDPPRGFLSPTVTLPGDKNMVRFAVRTRLTATEAPLKLVIEGRAKTADHEIVAQVVPAEDWMQAFLWRHLVPAQDLVASVYDPSYRPPPKRALPTRQPEAKLAKPAGKSAAKIATFSKQQVARRLNQLKLLYEEWLLTEDFYLRKVAECEAAL